MLPKPRMQNARRDRSSTCWQACAAPISGNLMDRTRCHYACAAHVRKTRFSERDKYNITFPRVRDVHGGRQRVPPVRNRRPGFVTVPFESSFFFLGCPLPRASQATYASGLLHKPMATRAGASHSLRPTRALPGAMVESACTCCITSGARASRIRRDCGAACASRAAQIFCDPESHSCGNSLFGRDAKERCTTVRAALDSIRGTGLRLHTNVRKGCHVASFGGRVVSAATDEEKIAISGPYTIQLEKDKFLITAGEFETKAKYGLSTVYEGSEPASAALCACSSAGAGLSSVPCLCSSILPK